MTKTFEILYRVHGYFTHDIEIEDIVSMMIDESFHEIPSYLDYEEITLEYINEELPSIIAQFRPSVTVEPTEGECNTDIDTEKDDAQEYLEPKYLLEILKLWKSELMDVDATVYQQIDKVIEELTNA
jgi:hypothetical protein